jgi:putative oxidoreductase
MTTYLTGAARSADPYGAATGTEVEVARGLTRVALGWFLLHQGWGKVVQDWTGGMGTFYRGDQFQNTNPDWLPTVIAAPYGYALPWLELVFGALLMLGLLNRLSAGGATLVFLSILVAWLDAGRLLPRHMLMIYAPLGAYFFLAGPGRFSLDALLDRRRSGARHTANPVR